MTEPICDSFHSMPPPWVALLIHERPNLKLSAWRNTLIERRTRLLGSVLRAFAPTALVLTNDNLVPFSFPADSRKQVTLHSMAVA
jgi:hypothetical protein